jgi:hypothetical protein
MPCPPALTRAQDRKFIAKPGADAVDVGALLAAPSLSLVAMCLADVGQSRCVPPDFFRGLCYRSLWKISHQLDAPAENLAKQTAISRDLNPPTAKFLLDTNEPSQKTHLVQNKGH